MLGTPTATSGKQLELEQCIVRPASTYVDSPDPRTFRHWNLHSQPPTRRQSQPDLGLEVEMEVMMMLPPLMLVGT